MGAGGAAARADVEVPAGRFEESVRIAAGDATRKLDVVGQGVRLSPGNNTTGLLAGFGEHFPLVVGPLRRYVSRA